MSKAFYPKLAFNNMKKNGQTYVPYIITCVCVICMFFILCSLANNSRAGDGTVGMILNLGVGVMAVFSVVFLFYTNSFLMKRRKKEFGLFNVLGMEKKHIAHIIFFETLYTYVISLVLGILTGLLLSKLVDLVFLNLVHFNYRFGFEISMQALKVTVTLFSVIFALLLLFSLMQIRLSNPIELIRGGEVGEKEPKTNWLIAILGVLCLGAGYWISVTTENPVTVLALFFVAVILVIVGTYCLFISGGIAVLKLLRKNKRYYYKPNHFIAVSGMIYRMKQNAAGLATICILATMVLVMISSTTALYFGIEDAVGTRFIREISVNLYEYSDARGELVKNQVETVLDAHNLEPKNEKGYRSLLVTCQMDGQSFAPSYIRDGDLTKIVDLCFIPLEDYATFTKDAPALGSGEALLLTNGADYPFDTLEFFGQSFALQKQAVEFEDFGLSGVYTSDTTPKLYVVVPMETIASMLLIEVPEEEIPIGPLRLSYGFDLDADDETLTQIAAEIREPLRESREFSGYVEARAEDRNQYYSLYGGLFFLGIFLGIVFIMATVLIIYYKQISEGYDDQKRYEIMQKVGLSKKETKRSIHSQILTMFFLPLLFACVHIAFAFPATQKMLLLLSLQNVSLFILTTLISVAVFSVFYVAVYAMTAKVYFKIVNSGQ